jgi:predicted nicotinamide N-methyase
MARPADPKIVKPDAAAFIRERLRLTELPGLPGIRLYCGRPDSGLGRFVAEHNNGRAPYWAYPWSGGLVLARYICDRPETVRGRRVLDLGAGGGIVAIAAARTGAAHVLAAEIDPVGAMAVAINAEASGVAIDITTEDLLAGAPPAVDLVLVGDLFYARRLARRTTSFLARCRAAAIDVLVGDPGRAGLPRDRLTHLAHYDVPEVGSPIERAATPADVHAFR